MPPNDMEDTTMQVNVKVLKALRERTGAGVMECREALAETGGHIEQAVELLRQKAIAEAAKRAARATGEGLVASYIHHDGKLGAIVEIDCETDFVARTAEFVQLARVVAEQVAAAAPIAVDEASLPAGLLDEKRRQFEEQVRPLDKPEAVRAKIVDGKIEAFRRESVLVLQPWVRDPARTIGDLVSELSGTVGEKIVVRRFTRFRIGEGVPVDVPAAV
jgi:elongation factor Ts